MRGASAHSKKPQYSEHFRQKQGFQELASQNASPSSKNDEAGIKALCLNTTNSYPLIFF